MPYAYIENLNLVELVNDLPINWRNVSNLSASKDDISFLNALGWYEADITTNYVENEFLLEPQSFVLDGGKVIVTRYELKPVETNQNDIKNSFFEKLRIQRDELLRLCDWTLLSDIVEVRDSDWSTKWKNYRQELRDLPKKYEETTNFDINSIEWPQPPNI